MKKLILAAGVLLTLSGCASMGPTQSEPGTVFEPQWLERCKVGVICAESVSGALSFGVSGSAEKAQIETLYLF